MTLRLDSAIGVEDFGKLVGVTRRTISDMIRRGVLRKRGRGLVLDEAVRDYVRFLAAKHATTPGVETGAEARARLARIKADIAQEQFQRGRGELVDPKALTEEWRASLAETSRQIMNIPWVMASRLSFIDRHKACMMQREIRICLSNIGSGRAPDENGPDTDFDELLENSLLEKPYYDDVDSERIRAEARARRKLDGNA